MKLIGNASTPGSTARRPRSNLAGIRRIYARQNFDQRRFAGAVLAEQGVDLAARGHRNPRVERERAGEALGQAGDREQRRGRRGLACQQ